MRIFTGKAVRDEAKLIEARTGFTLTPEWLQQFWRPAQPGAGARSGRDPRRTRGGACAARHARRAHRLRLGRRPGQDRVAARQGAACPAASRAASSAATKRPRSKPFPDVYLAAAAGAGRRPAALRGDRGHGDRRHRRRRGRAPPCSATARAISGHSGPEACGRSAWCRCSPAWRSCPRCWRRTARRAEMPMRLPAPCARAAGRGGPGGLLLAAALGQRAAARPMRSPPALVASGRDPSLLVAVTLSGGGARAAAFGYGVLSELRRTQFQWNGRTHDLLEATDVISGVSGGSILAAYYAAHGAEGLPELRARLPAAELPGRPDRPGAAARAPDRAELALVRPQPPAGAPARRALPGQDLRRHRERPAPSRSS